jgi:hypothetical protein
MGEPSCLSRNQFLRKETCHGCTWRLSAPMSDKCQQRTLQLTNDERTFGKVRLIGAPMTGSRHDYDAATVTGATSASSSFSATVR